ncbi:ATP-binding protein [Candidatus Poriferisodalis sp.]|uniref:ATP-binding protein n=1 Tax=Candidatus Poriferisodalis sp. TaxID=3101277 RepID=UPI003B027758
MAIWSPTNEDYRRIYREQNPWHSASGLPAALAPGTERTLATVLWRKLVSDTPTQHQIVLGPRRVGKTTVLYQTVRRLLDSGVAPGNIWWLRMDHPLLLKSTLGDLVRAIVEGSQATAADPLFLMLDEIVYAENWDLWLKTFHDDHWPVRVAATSSSSAALRKQRHESGIGRWEEHHLMPCLLDEAHLLLSGVESASLSQAPTDRALAGTLASWPTAPSLGNRAAELREILIMVGGYPQLLMHRGPGGSAASLPDIENWVLESQRVLRSDAVERAVYKDIPQATGIDSPATLERLLYMLAAAITGIMSPKNLSQDLGISQPTLDRYLTHLEQAYLVFTLTNYSGSEPAIQRRGRKLYFWDSAVRNAALQRGLAPLTDPVERGTLLENLVTASVKSLAVHAGIRLHYWREGNSEVDLIYDDPRQPLAIEIASSPDHHRRGLAALVERHPRFHGHSYLVAPGADVVPASREISGLGTFPLDAFLLAIGDQARLAMLTRLGIPSPAADVPNARP